MISMRTCSNCVAMRRGGKQLNKKSVDRNRYQGERDSASMVGEPVVFWRSRVGESHSSKDRDMVIFEATISVIGGSRLMSGLTCKSRRSVRIGQSADCLAEVRAFIVVKKRGNSRGAKGGRKPNRIKP